MLILTIRTDKPEAEIGLYQADKQLQYQVWTAHRQLAETLHGKLAALLKEQDKDWHDVEGIVCFEGPGSFTGLRIGLTVGNALAYSLGVQIVGTTGDDWQQQGIWQLQAGKGKPWITPEYGSPVHITQQKR